jgi:hypothetical protein
MHSNQSKQKDFKMEYVYILQSSGSNLFKVGKASNVEQRILQLNTGNPHQLIKFDIIETNLPFVCETYMHRTLLNKKHYGSGGTEFFNMTSEEMKLAILDAREFIKDYQDKIQTIENLRKVESTNDLIEPDNQLKKIFENLLSVKAKIDDLQYEQDLLEMQLKIAIGSKSGIKGVATWKSSKQNRFDAARFQEENEGLASLYKKQTIQRTFKIAQK